MQDLTSDIEKLIAKAKELNSPGLDKKSRNKVVARLEEAWLWSQHMFTADAQAARDNQDQQALSCICPEGGRDMNCPIHGTK